MVLEMYINGKLIDSALLSVHQFDGSPERDLYIQGGVNELLERWDKLIQLHDAEPQFFIRPQPKH